MGIQKDKVRFNVRGKIFETSATTLSSAPRNSMLGAMLDDIWKLQPREMNEEYFIDRNPDCFSALLDLLGTGELNVPPNIPEKLLYREAHYYGLLDHIRTAKWGQFDSNRLVLTGTVSGQAPSGCSAIRASPDGGCAVAHGSIVRIYDWMLQEHPPINLSYQSVNDIGWIDSENVVISVCNRLGKPPGGVGVFSSSTGALRHKFMLNHENQVQNFTAKALCLHNSDNKIFASCKGTNHEGIGVWDAVVGKQIDFFGSVDGPNGFPLGDADKIQWLNGSNCLFVWSYEYICFGLLDFRDKSIVWYDHTNAFSSRYAVDAIPVEETNSICVVSAYEDFGSIDIRSTDVTARWNSNNAKAANATPFAPHSYCPKLTFYGGQLFWSRKDEISVYCGGLDSDQWVVTSRLGKSGDGGSIRDFSIGGDRLFALHGENNEFDVWETPPAPII